MRGLMLALGTADSVLGMEDGAELRCNERKITKAEAIGKLEGQIAVSYTVFDVLHFQ
jgi:hypothetical protein